MVVWGGFEAVVSGPNDGKTMVHEPGGGNSMTHGLRVVRLQAWHLLTDPPTAHKLGGGVWATGGG